MPDAPENKDSRFSSSIAILGGGGFIGSSLILYLMQLGKKLHLLINKTDPGIVSLRGQVQTFKGSINDFEALKSCFTGCEAVYHLIGIIAETRTKTFQKTIVDQIVFLPTFEITFFI